MKLFVYISCGICTRWCQENKPSQNLTQRRQNPKHILIVRLPLRWSGRPLTWSRKKTIQRQPWSEILITCLAHRSPKNVFFMVLLWKLKHRLYWMQGSKVCLRDHTRRISIPIVDFADYLPISPLMTLVCRSQKHLMHQVLHSQRTWQRPSVRQRMSLHSKQRLSQLSNWQRRWCFTVVWCLKTTIRCEGTRESQFRH